MIARAIRRLREINRFIHSRELIEPSQEIVFRELFVRELRRYGIVVVFDPIGAAANHGLLYMIIRTVTKLGVRNVLEFGAGQSTLLLDQLARKLPGLSVRTIEHDALWAERIGEKVAHQVRTLPLVPFDIAGKTIRYYDPDGIAGPEETFELILVDGPPAFEQETRYNRAGFLRMIPGHVGRDFVVVIDDAERTGERFCVAALRDRLRELGLKFSEGTIRAAKTQCVFAGGAFASAGLI